MSGHGTAAATGGKRDAAGASPGRKLTTEETEGLTTRLYTQQQERSKQLEEKRQATLAKSRPPSKVISLVQRDALVGRIYTQQIERQAKAAADRQAKLEASGAPTRTITEADLGDMVQRMYNNEIEKKQRSAETLKKKYQPAPAAKKLDRGTLDESAKRLSHIDWQARDKALFDKHVAPLEPKTIRLPGSRLAEMADRLYTKK